MTKYKFRGWYAKNCCWHYGDLIKKYEGNYQIVGFPFSFDVVAETVGVWIGRKDKDGVDVYEGDVVESTIVIGGTTLPHMGTIVYDYNFCSFATKNEGGTTLLCNHCLNTLKVIGNIHEGEKTV